MWKYIKYPISLSVVCATLWSCTQSDYTKLVKSELAKGIRKDSILFDIHFGDNRQDFFGRCFDLNQQHLVTEGTAHSVQYEFVDSLVHDKPMSMRLLFYPTFDGRDVIEEMNMEFSYASWSPTIKALQADSLKVKVMDLLMKWYRGNEFVIAHFQNTEIPVKLDGNRRIVVEVKDAQTVTVKVQDILHPRFRHSVDTGNATKKESEKKEG